MKKAITITCLAASILLILSTSGTLDSLLLFITVGAIPGTTYSLSPNVMLALITLIIATIVLRIILRKNAVLRAHFERKLQESRRYFSRLKANLGR